MILTPPKIGGCIFTIVSGHTSKPIKIGKIGYKVRYSKTTFGTDLLDAPWFIRGVFSLKRFGPRAGPQYSAGPVFSVGAGAEEQGSDRGVDL